MRLDVYKIRRDFPALKQKINKKPVIYMDSACVSLKPVQVIDAVSRYYTDFPSCAGRSSHVFAKRVLDEVYNSRMEVRKFINAKKTEEIIFTKNSTEGINIIANSLNLRKGESVLISDKEHNSLLAPFQMLREKGIKLKFFRFGDIMDFKEKLTEDVRIVSTAHISNLDGTANPVKKIIRLSHKNNSLVLIDSAQSVPHMKINVRSLNPDFLVFSGHKVFGPSGTGVLYGKLDALEKLKSFTLGGGAVKDSTYKTYEIEKIPQRMEAGLQNYSGIIGLAEALRYFRKVGISRAATHEQMLNKLVSDELSREEVEILGDNDYKKRTGILSFNIKGFDSHEIAGMLNESSNIMIRSGMHCVHSWLNSNKINGSARISFSIYNTIEECMTLIEEVMKILKLNNSKKPIKRMNALKFPPYER